MKQFSEVDDEDQLNALGLAEGQDTSAPAPASVRDSIAARLATRDAQLKGLQRQAAEGRSDAGITEGLGQIIHGVSRSSQPFNEKAYAPMREEANAPVKDYLQRQAASNQDLQGEIAKDKVVKEQEALDPTSARSKTINAILTRYNPKLAESPIAAADAPMVINLEKTREAGETRKEIAAGRRDAKAGEDQKKADAELALKRSQLGSRGGNAKYVDALRRADNIQSLMNQYPNLNDMPKKQVNLLFSEIDAMVNGGAPTISGTHGITPDAVRSKAEEFLSTWQNKPRGAELGEFLGTMTPYIADVSNNAKKHLGKEHSSLIEGYKGRLSPDAYVRHRGDADESFKVAEPVKEMRTSAPAAPKAVTPFSDPDKEKRYQDWKTTQGGAR